MSKVLGVAASGHKETSKAAKILLQEGGNAFDAALGAMCTACVCEPMLASLGGGGFLLAQPAGRDAQVFDFFTQTPSASAGELDFYPIQADFGTATQEFHIGMGSIAVPGVVAGLFAAHRALCRLPLATIIEPAVKLAREGVRINPLQKYINEILQPIIEASPKVKAMASAMSEPGRLAEVGDFIANPELADMFERLISHGERWFYEGEPARQLVHDCKRYGGLISQQDMRAYQLIRRKPVVAKPYNAEMSFNSPPSPGGCLTAFALKLFEAFQKGQHDWGSAGHAMALARVMQAASLVRRQHSLASGLDAQAAAEILSAGSLYEWHETLKTGGLVSRGTTHISVVDAEGGLASLTLSNGEGSAYVLPGTGVLLNNMLGEEDLNPDGFHCMPPGKRLASMMTPAIVNLEDGSRIALGSGGSNRIRSAILQVLVNLFEYGLNLEQAVVAPRLHLEHNHLSIERGFSVPAHAALEAEWPGIEQWEENNLFFGGVHAVQRFGDGKFSAAGDPRRGGAIEIAESAI